MCLPGSCLSILGRCFGEQRCSPFLLEYSQTPFLSVGKKNHNKMEYLDSLVRIIELLSVGGVSVILTLRYQRRKAAAEAKAAEAEAEKANAEAQGAAVSVEKDRQDIYQQIIADLKTDRNDKEEYIRELKEDRQRLREENRELRKRQDETENTMRQLQHDVARFGRMVVSMRPFLCGDLECKKRILLSLTESGEIKQTKARKPKDESQNDEP